MKVSTTTIVVLSVACLLLAFGFGVQNGQARTAKKALESLVESKRIEVADLEFRVKSLSEEMTALVDIGRDAATNAERLIADLRVEREANRREREARAATAPPGEIMCETRRLLGTEEVWLEETDLVMSEAASRINLARLLAEESFRMVEIPAYSEILAEKDLAIKNYEVALEKASQREDIRVSIANLKDEIAADFEDYAKSVKKNAFKDMALWFFAGTIVGTSLVLIAR